MSAEELRGRDTRRCRQECRCAAYCDSVQLQTKTQRNRKSTPRRHLELFTPGELDLVSAACGLQLVTFRNRVGEALCGASSELPRHSHRRHLGVSDHELIARVAVHHGRGLGERSVVEIDYD